MLSSDPILVNIGCGPITHPAWHNYDVNPTNADVLPLRRDGSIPLPSSQATACYSSHVLEHVPLQFAAAFLQEQRRVLRGGGIIRVAVPDLQFLCTEYLRELSANASSPQAPSYRYHHTVAELLDQLVRTESHCELVTLWRTVPPADRDWVIQRVGYVAESHLPPKRNMPDRPAVAPPDTRTPRKRSLTQLVGRFACRAQESAAYTAVALVGGKRLADAFRCGLHRSQGEVHQWMYDEVSLRNMLAQCGFVDIQRHTLGNSRIPEWQAYRLELVGDRALKPHSLVMEAIKP